MYHSVINLGTRKDEKLRKESIKIIIYEDNNKTKVKLKNKNKKKAPDGVKNLHLIINKVLSDTLNKI